MNTNNLLYGINERPPIGKLALFSLQMMLSVFVATVLIANICGVAVSGALFGAGLSTLIYILVTQGKSPMFVSNSGAFVAPVIFALSIGGHYAVAFGGLVTFIVYSIFGVVFTKIPVDNIYKVFPKALIGSVTMVIGINLMPFILTYVQVNGAANSWGLLVAFVTMFVIAVISHYSKGIFKVLPFLIGTAIGYALAIILTITGVAPLVDFSVFSNLTLFQLPDLALTHWQAAPIKALIPVMIMYIAYTISAMMEALSDHAALGNIIGTDLYRNPGLGKIFRAEGLANLAGSVFGGLGICSYGEGVACIGFSRVASVWTTGGAAIFLMVLSVLAPVQALIASIPSCVFAGAAIILYGFIACSGVKMLQQVDLNISNNLILVSIVLSLGISGLTVGGATLSLAATALALVAGVIINLILKD
jgi:uracil permease